LLETLIDQRLLLLLKTLKTQSSRTPHGKGRLLLLKTQSSKTTREKGHLLLLKT
jgi:hypothetical protein